MYYLNHFLNIDNNFMVLSHNFQLIEGLITYLNLFKGLIIIMCEEVLELQQSHYPLTSTPSTPTHTH